MTVSMCVLLWPTAQGGAALARYEDTVLALLPDHGGRVRRRIRAGLAAGDPAEVQFLEFESQAGVDAYLRDPRRLALADERVAAVARTEVIPLARPLPDAH